LFPCVVVSTNLVYKSQLVVYMPLSLKWWPGNVIKWTSVSNIWGLSWFRK
jgi:hypothetical protein